MICIHDLSLFIYYLVGGKESDGNDETIYPVDYQQFGPIVDDELHNILVKPLPNGAKLTALFGNINREYCK